MGDDRRAPYTGTDVPPVAPEADAAALAERYRLLLEFSLDAIAIHQMGTIVYVNAAAVRFAGVADQASLVGRKIVDFVHPDSLPAMTERLATLGRAVNASIGPHEVTMLDGHGVAIDMDVTSVRTVWDGRPAHQVILRDLAPQKAAAVLHQAALVDHVSDAVIGVNSGNVIRVWNSAAHRMYGIASADAIGRPITEVVGADTDADAVIALGGTLDTVHHRADGTPLTVRLAATEMPDGYLLVAKKDTSQRPLYERLGTILASLQEAVVLIADSGTIELANPAALRILDLPPSSVPGVDIRSLSLRFRTAGRLDEGVDDTATDVRPILEALAKGGGFSDRTVSLRRGGGTTAWLSCSCQVADLDGPSAAAIVSFVDITERHLTAARHEWDATHDALTGLINRAGILAHLDALLGSDTSEGRSAVYFLDLDNFKIVNDSLGHSVGDVMLQIVGDRLRRSVPEGGVVGRLGGDEFVVVAPLPDVEPQAIDDEVRRLHDALTPPIEVAGRAERISASIGVAAVEPDDIRSSVDLLRDADIALLQAKSSDRISYARFTVELRQHLQRRQILEQDMRAALADNSDELQLAYQPIYDLSTMRPVAAEVLIRWQHRTLGAVSPAEFIPLSEQTDLVDRVGEFVMRNALTDLVRDDWMYGLLCVNVSRRELSDTAVLTRILDLLDTTGFPADRLCIEVTESAVTDAPTTTRTVLNTLREHGIKIAIDDFGIGSSSLNQLYRLPLDIIKVAQPFVADLGESDHARAIMSGIVGMAHATGLTVIAEGVETTDQLATVVDLGCDQAQGYYFCRPSPIETLTEIYRG
ncbi:EAL domain-containing protein [Williamsia sterculiae]|uniref:PAS domain S-box-containing protein/diguanylate cyclase (GGDEF) domain-containing protein n=1 Tax=Williamsia sterculiae TaxID=1344003 RepID=A0A1N7DRJ8_9NOCA|nr:EAL domain-containing protein [Williamsia sterculiae]SIR78315.1 PAS domain S-box-containing protein/diguanylate cyclase (GGDEF) domain-containing protein [Williamsia sterculiae]